MEHQIIGGDMQAIEVTLEPNETIIAEAGAMTFMDKGINLNVRLGDGSNNKLGVMGKLFKATKRAMAKESFFLTHFTNTAQDKKSIIFSAPFLGKVIAVHLSDVNQKTIYCQKDGFLCAEYGTNINIAFTKKLSTGFFGGEGFVLEKLSGEGIVFLHACGAIIKKELDNEEITVDTGSIVAFEEGVDYSVTTVGGLKTMMFAGEGAFFAKLSGTGTVYLQSLPFSRLANRIIDAIPSKSE